MTKRSVGNIFFDLSNNILMIIIIIVTGYPFLYILSYSLSDPSNLPSGIIFMPSGFSLDAYRLVFSNSTILHGIFISIARTLLGPAVMIFFTSMAAYCLTRDDLIAIKFLRKFFILTMYFSVGLIPVYILVVNLRLAGTFWVYIIPTAVSVFNMILIKTYIESIPKELEEAALIDGANDFYLFWRIIFPISLPVIAAVVLFSAVGQWNSFIDTQIYNAMSPELFPLQYILYQTLNSVTSLSAIQNNISSGNGNVTPQGLKMAITMINILPIAMVYPFLQRFFIKGLLIGSVKG